MVTATLRRRFQQAVEDWVCDSYSLDIRYLARIEEGQSRLWHAAVGLYPLAAQEDRSFHIETNQLTAGQLQLSGQSKQDLLHLLDRAAEGTVDGIASVGSYSDGVVQWRIQNDLSIKYLFTELV